MPDIYLQGQHSPCEHFAGVAWEWMVGQTSIIHDDDETPPGGWCRWHMAIVRRLAGEAPKEKRKRKPDEARELPLRLAGERIDWHLALPELRIWAGQATLETLILGRQQAIREALDAGVERRHPLDWRLPYKTMSGLDPRTAGMPLEIGFLPRDLHMEIETYVAAELLCVLGMQLSPMTRFSRYTYGYQGGGKWWVFRVVPRAEYHRMLTMSREATAS